MARNGLAHDKPYVSAQGYLAFKGEHVHRTVWKEAHGEIPVGCVVHHINHDKFDNRLENLGLVSMADHCKHHNPRLGTSKHQPTCVECGREKKHYDRSYAYCRGCRARAARRKAGQ